MASFWLSAYRPSLRFLLLLHLWLVVFIFPPLVSFYQLIRIAYSALLIDSVAYFLILNLGQLLLYLACYCVILAYLSLLVVVVVLCMVSLSYSLFCVGLCLISFSLSAYCLILVSLCLLLIMSWFLWAYISIIQ